VPATGSRSSAVRAVAVLFFEELRERKGERGREKKGASGSRALPA
jgi:hypothetical protein